MALTNFLIGKPGNVRGLKPKLGPNAPVFRTGLRRECDRIAKIFLTSGRLGSKPNESGHWTRTRRLSMPEQLSTKSSDLSFKEMQSNPSDTAKKSQAKKFGNLARWDSFLRAGLSTPCRSIAIGSPTTRPDFLSDVAFLSPQSTHPCFINVLKPFSRPARLELHCLLRTWPRRLQNRAVASNF